MVALIPERMTKQQLKEVGKRVGYRRETLGLSQRELSFPGCSYAYLSRIEKGARSPSLRVVILLSMMLRTQPLWLLWGFGPEESEVSSGEFLVFDPRKPKVPARLATKRTTLFKLLQRRSQILRELSG